MELAAALSRDLCQHASTQRKEDDNLKENETEVIPTEGAEAQESAQEQEPVVEAEAANPVVEAETENPAAEPTAENPAEGAEAEPVAEPAPESAALTDHDLRRALVRAYQETTKQWAWVAFLFPTEQEAWFEEEGRASEMDYKQAHYTVADDVVTLTDITDVKLTVSVSELNATLAARNDALAEANKRINELETQVSELKPYKDAADAAEQARMEAELAQARADFKAKMLETKLFEEAELESSEELKQMIAQRDEAALKMEIAERFMARLEQPQSAPAVETAAASAPRTGLTESADVDNATFMRIFLGKA
jgi:hypothetical protein